MKTTELTQEYLKSILIYDEHSGIFTRKLSLRPGWSGKRAGSINSRGYIQIKIDTERYSAHRLAWLYMTGLWPIDQIDHKNNVRHDNKWLNLRECTQAQNAANRKISTSNTSGYKGVHWDRKSKCWIAQLKHNYKTIHIGRCKAKEDAAVLYNDKAIEIFGEFACLNEVLK